MTNQSKVPYLAELAKENKYMYIAVTESHLKTEISSTEISIDNYTLYRADRKDRSHGGVGLYVRNDLTARAKVIMGESNSETEVLVVSVCGSETLIVTIYRPPKAKYLGFRALLDNVKNVLNTNFAQTRNYCDG